MAAIAFPNPAYYLQEASIQTSNYREADVPESPTSLEDLYSNHRDFTYRAALRVTRNAHDAEDVVQNVFLRMMRNDTRPDVGRNASAYLRRAATNAAIDLVRKRAQMAESELPSYQPAPEHTSTVHAAMEQRHVRQVLDKLPPKNARLFELHYRGGYLYEELAESFGIQVGTVKSRLHRIRAALQKEFQPAGQSTTL